MRLEWRRNVLVSGLYITLGRKRNPSTAASESANQELGGSSGRAHETRIIFVSVGFDVTRRGVMKLSKVVFHRLMMYFCH